MFDEHLTFSDQISYLSPNPAIPVSSASLYPSIPRFQNSFHHRHFHCSLQAWLLQLFSITTCPSLRSPVCNRSRTLLHVTSLPSHHIVSALLHWLKITERMEYKLLSLTYKVLTTTQPSNLHNIISVQLFRSTRSSSFVTLARPSTSSSPHITDRSFQYASPRLWNQLSAPLRQPRTNLSNSDSPRFWVAGRGNAFSCVCESVCPCCVKKTSLSIDTEVGKGKGSPYSITERRVPKLILVLGSQPADDVSHKPRGRLSLLSARPAVTLVTLKRAATSFAAWWTEARWV